MTNSTKWLITILPAVLLTASPVVAGAQGLGERMRRAAAEAAARTVERRAETKAEEATEAALDRAEQGAKSGTKAARGAATAKPPVARAAAGDAAAPPTAAPAATAAAPVRTDAGTDFIPGSRVLFATDFRQDEIGDFPRALRLRSGNAEVADVGGTRYLRITSIGELEIPLPETLPERFTIELDFAGGDGYSQRLHLAATDDADWIEFRPSDGGIVRAGGERSTADARGTREGQPFRVQVMADGEYVKVYLNGTRVANMPNAALGRSRTVRLAFRGEEDLPTLIGNVRIAAGGRDLYAALADSGRVTADGILFDTNSDRIRPESQAALREIADLLTGHPELRLAIEGHTDDVGGAAANQTLSTNRAAAVRRHLVEAHGIAADRLEARGYGASRPVAANATEVGRQKNRRVELVRL